MVKILENLSVYSVLVPLFCGLILLKYQEANARIMIILLVFASIPQLCSVLIKNNEAKNILYNLYILVEATLWCYLFFKNINNKITKKVLLAIITIQVSVTTFYFMKGDIRRDFYPELICLHFLVQVIWVLFYFYEHYRREEILQIEHQSMFWFCLGILIYAPAAYFFFAHGHIIYNNNGNYDQAKIIHNILNTLMYLIFATGMIMNSKIKLNAAE